MIRKANLKDINFINNLGIQINNNFEKTYNIKDYLNNEKYIILVNELNNIINGLLIIYNNVDNFELEIIVVDNEYRNRGIAGNLLNYFFENLGKNKEIILEVAVNNIKAIKLYKKNKFEIINVRKKYYKNIDAYVMKRVVF